MNELPCSTQYFEANRANGPTSMGFDMSKVKCYNCHRKGHFLRECRSPKDARRNGAAEPQRRNVSVKTSTSNAIVSQYIKLLKLEVQLRDKALVTFRQNLKKAEQERDGLKLKLEKFQTSSKNLTEFLASQTHAKTGLGYNSQVFTRAMFDYNDYLNDYLSSGSDESLPPSLIYDRYQSGNGYHVVPLPYTGTFMPSKPDLVSDLKDESETKTSQNVPSFVQPTEQVKSPRPSVQHVETSILAATPKPASPKPTSNGKHMNRKACFVCKSLDHLIKDCDYHENIMAQPTDRNHAQRGNHKQYAQMTLPNPQRHVVPTLVLTQSKSVPITAVRQVTTAIPKTSVTRPRQAKIVVTKINSPPRRHINRSLSPKASTFPSKVTVVQAPMVNAAQGDNPQHALKDKGVIDSGCSRHMTWNMFYLSDFEELNGGYVTFGGNPKGGKISRKGKIRIGKLDFDDVYFVKELKFNLFSVSWMVLVTKHQNKTPYELLHGRTPSIGFMRPFGCPVTILNTLDFLGKFYRKVDEGFLVGYSVSSKAFRVFNSRTRIVQETLHVNFMENKPNVAGSGPTWLFDIDTLTKTMNYHLVIAGNQSNPSAGVQEQFDAEKAREESDQHYEPEFEGRKPECEVNVSPSRYRNLSAEFENFSDNSINEDNDASTLVPAVGKISPNSTNTFIVAGPSNATASPTHKKSSCIDTFQLPDDPNMPELEEITYSNDEDDVGAEADFNNLETSITVSPIPITKVHKDHHVTQIIGDLSLATQTRSMTRVAKDQGHTQEDGIDYEEVFTPVARIEAITLFLAYASFMGFMVYQMDVKSAFLYGTIKEEVYVCQPLGFEDPDYHDKVYKVVKALYGLHQALRAWYETLTNYLLENGFQIGKIDQTLFIKRQKGNILLVQIYVDDIIFGLTNKDLCKAFKKLMKDKFQMSSMGGTHILFGSSTSTPIDTEKPLLKDHDGEDVDVHTYRSMIGSLMYLTSSRPDIMFAVCACAHFQVTPKALHLHAVKMIFRYLKGKPHLGLWYLKDSPFDLVAYSDSDYAGASLDRKSTTRGCQFLGCRLISWQCKKQTVVATSSTEVEYVVAASCCT
uniref:Putative ribonuclease H-like domain-containing protein n=1 Tax=Tanacetum cinerariifolium TaxID=118510 RepID=A0A6L2MQ79_TANCI|nr:putative ribonuclease H-like domain-containing protein [Tanacetum cinerariifolium]